MYGIDRKIYHEGPWSASQDDGGVMPNSNTEWQIFPSDADKWPSSLVFLSTPYTHGKYFFLHTFWFTRLDLKEELAVK